MGLLGLMFAYGVIVLVEKDSVLQDLGVILRSPCVDCRHIWGTKGDRTSVPKKLAEKKLISTATQTISDPCRELYF